MRRRGGDVLLTIPVGAARLSGDLALPCGMLRGLVLFAHGSGSSRLSPRNRLVAHALRDRGLGTLLFDLLTTEEERADEIDAHLRFDIPLLAGRLVAVTDWVHASKVLSATPIGYFGASTGAAAALIAAAQRPQLIGAVVSRGGRPDLAGGWLEAVRAPTLMIVGGDDTDVLDLNREAARAIRAPKRLAVVEGATHLFEEPGALEEVGQLAGDWLLRHLDQRATAGTTAAPPAPGDPM